MSPCLLVIHLRIFFLQETQQDEESEIVKGRQTQTGTQRMIVKVLQIKSGDFRYSL